MLRKVAALLLLAGVGAHPAAFQKEFHTTSFAAHSGRPTPPNAQEDQSSPILPDLTMGRQLLAFKWIQKRFKKIPRKVALRRHPPLGCQQFKWPPGIKSLAIVGNGPISSKDRKEIKGYDAVMRFNKMDNFQCNEPVTIWMLRYSYEAPDKYHGLNSTGQGCRSEEVLKKAHQVWLMDGEEFWLKEALEKHPELKASEKLVWGDGRQWDQQYSMVGEIGTRGKRKRKWRVKGTSPSSGWLGISIALECRPPGVEIHLYGFNWHTELWETHMVDREEAYWRSMAKEKLLVIHDTECKELRGCDGAHKEMLEVAVRV